LGRGLIMAKLLVHMDLQAILWEAILGEVILWELIRLLADSAVALAEVLVLVEALALTAGEVVAGDSGGKLKVRIRLS